MIKYILFNEKGVAKSGVSADYPHPAKKNYLFLFIVTPTREEIEKVSAEFKFDKEQMANFARETHSRRYITVPFQFVMKSVYLENQKIDYANLLFVLTDNCLIVASSKDSKYYAELFEHIVEEFKATEARGVIHILCHFLQDDVDENYDVLGEIEEKIKDIEFKVAAFEKNIKVNVDDVIYLKSQLFKLSRQFWAVARVLSLIRMGVSKVPLDSESVHLLLDIHETFLHQIDVAAAQKEMLSDAISVYATGMTARLSTASNELNVIVKRLTAYSLILIAPTVLTGIYGMNFIYIPLAKVHGGFYMITGAVVTIMLSIFFYAKKKGWL